MRNLNVLASLSLNENDRRLLITLLIVFVVVLFLIGILGILIHKTMTYQSRRAHTLMHDPVKAGVITDERHFKDLGRRKNARLYFKQSFWGVIIGLVGLLVWAIVSNVMGTFNKNPFYEFEQGFFFEFQADDTPRVQIFNFFITGVTCTHTPTPVIENIPFYIEVPMWTVSIVWILVATQAYVARAFELNHLSKTVFEKSLDGFKVEAANDAATANIPQPPTPPKG